MASWGMGLNVQSGHGKDSGTLWFLLLLFALSEPCWWVKPARAPRITLDLLLPRGVGKGPAVQPRDQVRQDMMRTMNFVHLLCNQV